MLIEQPNAPKAFTKKSGEYRIVIPPSGVLRLGDAWILHRWHSVQASFPSGASVPVPSSSGFGFHSGSTSTTDGRTYFNWFYVGDYPAAQDFFNGPDHISRQTEWLDQHNVK